MIDAITEKTAEFLQACKEAGYERITIFVHNKRVPDSCMIREASTGWKADEDGLHEHPDTGKMVFGVRKRPGACFGSYWGIGNRDDPFKVVCGAPAQSSIDPRLSGKKTCPAMWEIVHRLGLHSRGAGHGEGHDVLCPAVLTAGYYDLAEPMPQIERDEI